MEGSTAELSDEQLDAIAGGKGNVPGTPGTGPTTEIEASAVAVVTINDGGGGGNPPPTTVVAAVC